MKLASIFDSLSGGSDRQRALLTPAGLAVFFCIWLLVIFMSHRTDSALGFPKLFPGILSWIIGIPLLAAGLMLWAWCVAHFIRARGTPVPFNPPRELVTVGPYARSRNPMMTGVFACMFGLGFFLHSISMVCIWVPLLVLAGVILLKLVEEPQLERRFGESYREYCRRVPMFIPRLRSKR